MDGAPLELIDHDETWGDQPFGAPMPKAFRLSDAERIAARRLEGAAEGSLKEALATIIVEATPENISLGERLQKVAATAPQPLASPPVSASPFAVASPSEVDFGWFGAVPPAHAVPCFEEREPLVDAHCTVASATLAAPEPIPEIMPVPAPAPQPGPLPIFAPHTHAPALPIVLAREDDVDSDRCADVPLAIDTPSAELPLTPQTDTPAPLHALPEDPNLEPLVTAYAASARLAADAAAASQALFELQRLLNQQRLEASPELNGAMEAHGLAGLDAIPVAQLPVSDGIDVSMPTRAPDPATDANLMPPRVIQQQPRESHAGSSPPPLPAAAFAPERTTTDTEAPRAIVAEPPPALPVPLHAPAPQPSALHAPAHGVVSEGQLCRAPPSQPPAARMGPARGDRRRAVSGRPARTPRRASSFDVRGFAAGFVLSGAIGVVLYLVMATS